MTIKQRRAPHNASRIHWTKELQFLAIEDGWAMIKDPATQLAWITMYNDVGRIRFKTPLDADCYVMNKAFAQSDLHLTATSFVAQQKKFHWNGSFKCPCRPGALRGFYHREAVARREKRRIGNRVPEHQRKPPLPPMLKFTKEHQYAASLEGWVLHMAEHDRRVMPRTTDYGKHRTDFCAEQWVEQQASRDEFCNREGTLHQIAIEIRDRWLIDRVAAPKRARWGRSAKRFAEVELRLPTQRKEVAQAILARIANGQSTERPEITAALAMGVITCDQSTGKLYIGDRDVTQELMKLTKVTL